MIRPRRSVLFMPGSNTRALKKARTLPADGLILDLEDAVAPDAKTVARNQIVDTVKAGGFGAREVLIRINSVDTPWHHDDLSAAIAAAPDGIVVPKISSPRQLETIGARLSELGANPRIRIWAMIESPRAVLDAAIIAATAENAATRLAGFLMGTNDIAKEARTMIVPGRGPMLPWLMTCIAAARAYGLQILDGVFNDIGDIAGFARECGQAREMGFDGKTLIHPNQIAPCNAAFSPTPEEIAQARTIIAAFDRPDNRDKGVVQIDGRMVERMHADMARQIVAIADASKQ